MYNKKLSYFLFLLLQGFTLACFQLSIKVLEEKDLRDFFVIEAHIVHSGADACISKISNRESIYILKQINDASLDEQFLLINDCIASTIGYDSGVPINQVAFMPYNVGANLKMFPGRAATLHSFIPGKDLESELPTQLDKEFSIQQRARSPWQQHVLDEQQGLTMNVIENMSCHNSLALIAAFDTFIGNSDRSLPNLFYDKKTESFYGIDHAAAFTKKLTLFSCDRLNSLINVGYFQKCPIAVFESLTIYTILLTKLQNTIYFKKIHDAMLHLACHLAPCAENNEEIQQRIRHHSHVIEHNYCNNAQLLMLLNKITSK